MALDLSSVDINSLKEQAQLTGSSMPSPSMLFFGIVFSLAGVAYIAYGHKKSVTFLLAGICLMVFSFFSFDLLTYAGLGILFLILPFIIDYYL